MKKLAFIFLVVLLMGSASFAAIEDLENDYTEADPDSASWFPTAYEIRFWTNANTTTGVYKTFSTDYFNTTFTHTFSSEAVYYSSTLSPELIIWGLSDGGFTEANLDTANHGVTVQWDRSSSGWFLKIRDWAVDAAGHNSAVLSEDTEYFFKIVGNGTTVKCTVYASAAHRTAGTPEVTSCIETLSDGSDKYSTFIAQGFEDGTRNNTIVAISGNFDLGDVPSSSNIVPILMNHIRRR